MKVVIHPYRNSHIEKRCDWIDDRTKLLFIKMITNSPMSYVLNAHRLYPPKLNQEILNWILHDEL
jgi:hypothetical protein